MAVDSDYRVSFEEPEKISNPLLSFRKLSVGYNSELVLKRSVNRYCRVLVSVCWEQTEQEINALEMLSW